MIVRHAWVLLGLALIAVPIAIHLLVRAPAQTIDLPSLRFVRPSRMRALRRRLIDDAGLLAMRALALTVAVLALADPLLVTGCRRRAWEEGIRTVVMLHDVDARAEVARRALAGSEASVSSPDFADGLWRAQVRLTAAGPGRREILVVSRFAAGSVDTAVVRAVPAHVGLQLVRAAAVVPAQVSLAAPAWTTGEQRVPVSVFLTPTTTRLVAGTPAPAAIEVIEAEDAVSVPAFGLRLEHALAERADGVPAGRAARAAVHSVIATGIGVPAAATDVRSRPLVLRLGGPGGSLDAPATWMGSIVRGLARDPALVAGAAAAVASGHPSSEARVLLRDRDGAPIVSVSTRAGSPASLVLDLHAPATSPILPLLTQQLMASRSGRLAVSGDPMTIDDEQLAAWSRPAARPPDGDVPAEWSDRRWAWTLAIVLLAIEWMWRRRRNSSRDGATGASGSRHAA